MLWIVIALLVLLLIASVVMHVFSYSGYQARIEEFNEKVLEVQRETFKAAYAEGIKEGVSRERLRVLREEYKRYEEGLTSQG